MSAPKRHIALALALLLILAIPLGLWLAAPPFDPVYNGKPEHVWLADLQQWDADTNRPAFKAFQALGPRALPQLLAVAQKKPPFRVRLANFANRHQSLIRFLVPPDTTWRQNLAAIWAIYALGTNAFPAYPELTNMLFSPRLSPGSPAASIALAGMGRKSIPVLLQALTNQDAQVREGAAIGLGWERQDIPSLIPPLITCVEKIEPAISHPAASSLRMQTIRNVAISSLAMLHTEPEIVVPALIHSFPNCDTSGRVQILSLFGVYGTNAQSAIPLIESSTNDSDPNIRFIASSMLHLVAPGNLPAIAKYPR